MSNITVNTLDITVAYDNCDMCLYPNYNVNVTSILIHF